jgi:hypothetical protein
MSATKNGLAVFAAAMDAAKDATQPIDKNGARMLVNKWKRRRKKKRKRRRRK